jgi:hypothetical protein
MSNPLRIYCALHLEVRWLCREPLETLRTNAQMKKTLAAIRVQVLGVTPAVCSCRRKNIVV